MTEDEYQNLAATYLTRLMKRDAAAWRRHYYYDDAGPPPGALPPSSARSCAGCAA